MKKRMTQRPPGQLIALAIYGKFNNLAIKDYDDQEAHQIFVEMTDVIEDPSALVLGTDAAFYELAARYALDIHAHREHLREERDDYRYHYEANAPDVPDLSEDPMGPADEEGCPRRWP